ncbi:hypothetical protein HYR69_09510 [Candidatus Sumerlaeota bacterium]|nr:hypothetical protein [Candidatus Sumerlaeota bacterium]MBI3737298.1 hypothetical protein [Candidatus Sumerlaeota bacterium]
MRRWLRVVLPNVEFSMMLWFGGLFFLILAPVVFRVAPAGKRFVPGEFFSLLLITATFPIYGTARAGFFPFNRPDYRKWLEATPWNSSQPLPLGPAHLVAQDCVILGFLMMATVALFAHLISVLELAEVRSWIPFILFIQLMLFLLPYLGFLTGALIGTGEYGCAYLMISGIELMLFGQLVAIRLRSLPLGIFSSLLILPLYFLLQFGCKRALSRFPWQSKLLEQVKRILESELLPGARSKRFNHPESPGWAYDPLLFSTRWEIRAFDILCLSGIFAATLFYILWFYAYSSATEENARHFRDIYEPRVAIVICLFFGAWPTLCRLAIYTNQHRSPLSFGGRMLSGKLIIPSYDRVLLSPILSLISLGALPHLFLAVSVPSWIGIPISSFLYWLILFGMGPTLRNWRLTASHRIVAPTRLSSHIQL